MESLDMTNLLTWSDVWKLFLTITASLTSPLLIIWANFIYQRNRERKEKQEYLWRSLNNGLQRYPIIFDKFDEILENFKKGEPTLKGFYIPKQEIEFSERLAEICPPNYSYVYSDYANQLQTIQITLNLLTDVLREIYKTLLNNPVSYYAEDGINRKVCSILEARIEAAKEEMIKLMKKELEVLHTLESSSKQFKKDGDKQFISNFSQGCQDLEKKFTAKTISRKAFNIN